MPWHWKLLTNQTLEDFKLCPEDLFLNQKKDKVRSYLESPGGDICKPSCSRESLQMVVSPLNNNLHPCLQISKTRCVQELGEETKARLNVWFPNTEIENRSRVLRVDIYMFINAIGGGLGLFLGWSVISMILSIGHGFKKLKQFLFKRHTS